MFTHTNVRGHHCMARAFAFSLFQTKQPVPMVDQIHQYRRPCVTTQTNGTRAFHTHTYIGGAKKTAQGQQDRLIRVMADGSRIIIIEG